MVVGTQAPIPSAAVTRRGGLQIASQADRERRGHLHRATHPSFARHFCGRHVLRSAPRPPPARRARGVYYALLRFRCVHDHRGDVPYLDARRPRTPAAARRGLARALRAPLDGHLNRGLLEFPLAPVPPAPLHRVWRAPWRCTPRAARRAAWRVWCVRRDAPHRLLGAREGVRVQQRWRVLPSHGRRRGARGLMAANNRYEGAGCLGLAVDDRVDTFVGHVYARWVGTTRPHRMRRLPA